MRAGDREHRRQVDIRQYGIKLRQSQSLFPIGFSQRDLKIIQHEQNTKVTVNSQNMSKHFMEILRHGGCHEADGAVRLSFVLTRMEDAEQTQNWIREDWIDAFGCSTDKPRLEYWQDQNGTIIIYTRAVQRHSNGVAINPQLFSLQQMSLNKKEHVPSGRKCSQI